MQRSQECKIAQTIPQRPNCVKELPERGATDGKAPGTNRSQMTSNQRGSGDFGLKGTRPYSGPCPRTGIRP